MPKLLDNSIVGEHEKFLIYGATGAGKTFCGGTLPGTIYALAVGGANEFKTLRSPIFLSQHPEKEGKIWFDYVAERRGRRGIMEEAEAFDIAGDCLDAALDMERKGDVHFDSILIDGGTGLRGAAMNKAIEITHSMAKSADKAALTRLREKGILIPQDTDWGSEQSLIWQFISWCFELPKNLCFITHEWNQTKMDRGTRELTVLATKPAFTGKQRDDVPTLFDNVWRLTTSGGKRSIQFEAQTVADDTVDAKTRMGGVLPEFWRNPDLSKAIEMFKDAYKDEAAVHE